ncbi:MAG: alpha-amylase family glycosyl hydrolase, partial [Bacteroidales bacterium]
MPELQMNIREFYLSDPWLAPFNCTIESRINKSIARERHLTAGGVTIENFATGHYYYGIHRDGNEWVFREWAPNAKAIFLIGTFNGWKEKPGYGMSRINDYGDWEIKLPSGSLHHGDLFKLSLHWDGGGGERIPSYATRVVQDEGTKIFSAQVWWPDEPYRWEIPDFIPSGVIPVIYEAHVGMATAEEKLGTYREFTENVLPYIARSGYNTIQLMAIQEHPFYGSFGYHVSSFFAASSRFGTPEELKSLIDNAHKLGVRVIMDLVHSHSVKNINEGLGLFDGTPGQYFHTNERRYHVAWDSLCFDYGKDNVLHFLLSNCRFWLE